MQLINCGHHFRKSLCLLNWQESVIGLIMWDYGVRRVERHPPFRLFWMTHQWWVTIPATDPHTLPTAAPHNICLPNTDLGLPLSACVAESRLLWKNSQNWFQGWEAVTFTTALCNFVDQIQSLSVHFCWCWYRKYYSILFVSMGIFKKS